MEDQLTMYTIAQNLIFAAYPHGWVLAIDFLYVSLGFKIWLHEWSVYKRTKRGKQFTGGSFQDKLKNYGMDMAEITYFKLEINSMLGFLPLLILGEFLITTVLVLVFVVGEGNIEYLQQNSPFQYCQLCFIHLVQLLIMDKFNNWRPNFQCLSDEFDFTSLSNDPIVISLQKTTKTYYETKYTVYNIISYDRSILSAFLFQVSFILVNLKH